METKVCNICKKELSLELFTTYKGRKGKLSKRGYCKKCEAVKDRNKYLKRYARVKGTLEYKQKRKDWLKTPKGIECILRHRKKQAIRIINTPDLHEKLKQYSNDYYYKNFNVIASKKKMKRWNELEDIGIIHIDVEIDIKTALLMFETVYSNYHTIVDITGKEYIYAELL